MRAPSIAIFLAIFPCALPLAADSRTGLVSTTAQGGVFEYASFLATGGLSTNWQVTAIPAASLQANQVQVSCSGNGVQAYAGTFNLNGTTVLNIPITPTASYGQDNCAFNFSESSNQYAPVQITLTVSQNALSYASTNAETQLDPVSTASGELFEALPADLSEIGPINLQFMRGYGSFINTTRLTTRMGANWTHDFEWELTLSGNGNQAAVTFFGSEAVTFVQSGGAWQLTTPERFGYQFASPSANTYEFLDPRTNLIYTFSGTTNTLGISTIQDRNGNTLTVSENGNSANVSDGLGRAIQLNFDPQSGNVVSVNDQDNRSVSFSYTGGNLTQFTDANGNSNSFSYTSANGVAALMTGHTFPLGNTPFTNTFDSIGRVATETDASGNATAFTYDQPVGNTAFADPFGNTSNDSNQNYSNLLTHTDPSKQSLTVVYDANGHRTSVTDRLGNKITATYHSPSGYLASITDALGKTTTFTWVAQTTAPFTFYNLSQIQYADGTSVSYTYDANGNVLTATDQTGQVSRFAYNSRGQLLAATDPDGHATDYTYNSNGTLATITDAAGNVTTYSYDGAYRINQLRLADGNTRSFAHDNVDHLTRSVNELGQVNSFAYNNNEELQSVTDPHSQSSSIVYNAQNQVQSKTDRTLDTTTFAYDLNDLLKSVTTAAGETYSVTRDTHDRVATAIDPAAKATSFGYNKEDALTSVTDALSRTTSITRDALGRETALTTPLGETYAVAYDSLSRVTSTTDPTGIATAFTYDPRGLPASVTVGALASTFARDNAGLLTGITDPNGNTWSYAYDSGGRLKTATDPLKRATAYSYDSRNRLASIQLPSGSVSFSYDPASNLLQRSYSDGTVLNYTYDPVDGVNDATGVTLSFDFEGRILISNNLIITRDADGRISSITYAANKTVKYAYNSAGLLASITDWIGGTTTFTYDAAHELTAITRPNKLGTQYTYDQDGRIASISEDAGPGIAINRDAAGRVLSETRTQGQAAAFAAGTLPLAYDAADEVASFTYDANGRVLRDTLRTYTWDLASRLTSYAGADGTASFTYDGFGLRTSVTNAVGTLNFVWNYSTTLPSLAIVRNSNGDLRYYVYLPGGRLLYSIDAVSNARHYYHFDENGSTTLLTDDTASITDLYGITPYGETVTQNGSSDNPFTWHGQFGVMQEGSTGLFYVRSRYYDSSSGRFLSPDVSRSMNPLKTNPYEFAQGNPVEFENLMGLGTTQQPSATLTLPAFSSGPQPQFGDLFTPAARNRGVTITRYVKPRELLERPLGLAEAPATKGIVELTRDLDHPVHPAPLFNPFESESHRKDFEFLPFVPNAADIVNEFFGSLRRAP